MLTNRMLKNYDKMSLSNKITHAFILGAGLGKRLRPLTESLPKPLLPIKNRPLVTYALEHLARIGVQQAVINTHHAAQAWTKAFPSKRYANIQITFRHESTLLDTGGGLKNVEDFLKDHGTFFIYNGDILTSLPLEKALAHHRQHKNLVTMALRSAAEPKHVALDINGKVIDIRGILGSGQPGTYLFTGIHVVEPEIFQYIPDPRIQSIITIYLDLIRKGLPIGGVVLDEGEWSDIGNMSEYERVKG